MHTDCHMRTVILLLLMPAALLAQAFPRASASGGLYSGSFTTEALVNPDEAAAFQEATRVSFEDDLGLPDSDDLQRFSVQWRPFRNHELGASFFSASRSGFEDIDREIRFGDTTYPVRAEVTSQLDIDFWDVTYTGWLRRSDRAGLGLTFGVSGLSIDAAVAARLPGEQQVSLTENVATDVPVPVFGLDGRVALGSRFILEGRAATLPNVTLDQYSGRAFTGAARIEFRPARWVGIGAAYNYFRLDADVSAAGCDCELALKVQGPEAYVRLLVP